MFLLSSVPIHPSIPVSIRASICPAPRSAKAIKNDKAPFCFKDGSPGAAGKLLGSCIINQAWKHTE